MDIKPVVTDIAAVEDEKFYRVADLQSVLKNLGLNYSIFSVRDAETWKCLNYKCGKRYTAETTVCEKCGNQVRAPIIGSPRTMGTGKGVGHRKYTGAEIKQIVNIFKKRP